ncbi:hypothetical protein [Rhizorhabdus phycosphaerae]|uniref:hypothetical protein n=1 Tax=Rhizorhabdus phycosphaerae TaxID=2711156 RepID=UPI0013EAD62D|nr:hypothetical protein [Rhizorhabdus phycosphaerae]
MTKHDKQADVAQPDAPKQPWAAPQMIEIDAVAATLAGGDAVADQDPNRVS